MGGVLEFWVKSAPEVLKKDELRDDVDKGVGGGEGVEGGEGEAGGEAEGKVGLSGEAMPAV